MTVPLPRRSLWRGVIYLCSLLLVVLAFDLNLVRQRRIIHPGFETTRILKPLKPDGSIDYLAAVEAHFGAGITAENNAAPLVLQAVGRKALASNQPPDGITDRLGMPHLPEQGDYFVPYEEYCQQHSPADRQDDPTDPAAALVWPMPFNGQTRQWIKDNEKPLAILTEASKRKRFFIPFDGGYRTETMPEILIPHVALLRQGCQALLVRAMIRLESGDELGFHEDMIAVHRLARALATGPTLVERISAVDRIEIPACRFDRLAAASGKLSAKQARNLAADIALLGDLEPIDDTVSVGERYMVLDTIAVLARANPSHAGQILNALLPPGTVARIEPTIAFHLIPIQYEASMRELNHFYDGAMAALGKPDYPQKRAALQLWEAQVNQAATRHGPVMMLTTSDWAVAILPALVQAFEHSQTASAQCRLAQVALALAAYKAEHAGTYPATLTELAPAYLASVPADPFSDQPFVYTRSGAGYTLYSVGPNMIDDAGQTTKPGDDVVASWP